MEYKTKQIGKGIIIFISLFILAFGVSLFMIPDIEPDVLAAFSGSIIVFFLVIILFGSLETTVNSRQIKIKFGIGLIKKQIELSEIESIRKVTNKFWYGWGIRLTPHGWLWNIAGYEAVEINFKTDKKSFRIGCKSNTELYSAIKSRL